ncbi:MAG: hypothetical protein AB7H77_04685, partial [Bdellovibrionales bacterium]
VVEIRYCSLSTDKKEFLIGTPGFDLPVPFTSGGLPFPELALYKSDSQQGVAKFAMTAYEAKTGKLIQADDPQYGKAERVKRTVLVFVSWTENDSIPDEEKDIVTRKVNETMPHTTFSNK